LFFSCGWEPAAKPLRVGSFIVVVAHGENRTAEANFFISIPGAAWRETAILFPPR
jgi:hypothetical protein